MTFREMLGDWFHPTAADLLGQMEERVKSLEERVLAAEQKQASQTLPTTGA